MEITNGAGGRGMPTGLSALPLSYRPVGRTGFEPATSPLAWVTDQRRPTHLHSCCCACTVWSCRRPVKHGACVALVYPGVNVQGTTRDSAPSLVPVSG